LKYPAAQGYGVQVCDATKLMYVPKLAQKKNKN